MISKPPTEKELIFALRRAVCCLNQVFQIELAQIVLFQCHLAGKPQCSFGFQRFQIFNQEFTVVMESVCLTFVMLTLTKPGNLQQSFLLNLLKLECQPIRSLRTCALSTPFIRMVSNKVLCTIQEASNSSSRRFQDSTPDEFSHELHLGSLGSSLPGKTL